MAAGSRDRPPILATGRYLQWRSQFLRYVDTRPNGDALRKCILSGPYKPTTVVVQAVAKTDDSPAIPEHTTVETPMNMSPANKAHFELEKEAIHLILSGIRDEIYSTVDACQTAPEMWEAIERLQQGKSLNIQDVKTNLFWEFGKFTSHDGKTIESYYTRFYKLMNETIQNNLTVATIQVNVQFLQQLQPEWSRYKGKEIAKPITPPSESAFEEDNDPKQAQRDKDMQKNLALIAKNAESQKRLKTQGVIRKRCLCANKLRKEVPTVETCTDSEPLEKVQNDTGYNVFANDLQHSEQSESISNTCIVETDDSNVIPDSPDMCDDDIQNDQNDVECDDERAALANLIATLKLDVDENKKIQKQLKKAITILAQELKEYKTILAETSKTLRESNSVRDSCLVALQNKQTEFEKYKDFNDQIVDNAWVKHSKDQFRALTAQDMEILIQTCLMPFALKIQNDSFIYVHELKQEMHVDLNYVESLENKIDELESDKPKFSNIYDMILQESMSNEVMCTYLLSLSDLYGLAELQCLYLYKVKECDCLAQKLLKQTESVSNEGHTELLQRFSKVEKHSISLEIALQKCKEQSRKGSEKPIEEDTHASIDTSLNHEEGDQEIDEPQSDINPIRKSSRTRRALDRMCLHVDAEEYELGDLGEPANYKFAILDPESEK
uniref:Integrase, catalytic region, zinc finger, CCHC-type, peptidase aspartic, catalytic n=1 Tax=Tanacetum cinerariifolium TaxID=118510 RepID=A0A6L2KPE6_TANCI|nr:hypothetical protein [Tanacetum cinerariifolium]